MIFVVDDFLLPIKNLDTSLKHAAQSLQVGNMQMISLKQTTVKASTICNTLIELRLFDISGYLSPELVRLHRGGEHGTSVGEPNLVKQPQLVGELGGQLGGTQQADAEVVVVPHLVLRLHEEEEGVAQGRDHDHGGAAVARVVRPAVRHHLLHQTEAGLLLLLQLDHLVAVLLQQVGVEVLQGQLRPTLRVSPLTSHQHEAAPALVLQSHLTTRHNSLYQGRDAVILY